MKKIILLTLIVFASSFNNDCFASDTLFVFFNPADSNQYVTKNIRRILIPSFFKHDMCVIEKSCWLNYPLQDSGKTTQWQFCFTYLLVADSVTQNESDAVEDAWELTKRYEEMFHDCKTRDHPFDKMLARAIKVYKEYNKYGHVLIKKETLVYHDLRVIDLSAITTKAQLTELGNSIQKATIFLIDLAQQHRKNKWLAYKTDAIKLAPIENKHLQF